MWCHSSGVQSAIGLVAAPGVVDQDVQPSLVGDGARHELLAVTDIGDVGGNNQRAPAEGLDVARGLLQRLPAPPGEHDVGAVLSQHQRASPPDARTGAGDDCHPAVQRKPAHTTAPPLTPMT